MPVETKRVRWQCPNDAHPAVLGSRRPPLDSIVRYCLPCSQTTGRLVKRVAPVLEREREAAAARSQAKAKAKRERAAAEKQRQRRDETERYTVEGVDLRTEFARLIRVRAFGGPGGRMHKNPPTFEVRRRTARPVTLGKAYPGENRIVVVTYPGQTLAEARETLVHELAHIADRSLEGAHGKNFYRLMDAAVLQAYGATPKGVRTNSYEAHYGNGLTEAAQKARRR